MNKYPIGATWEGTDIKTGRVAKIWLVKRLTNFEIWQWSWYYDDGSHSPFANDWGTSYQSCKDQLPFSCRMKRIK